MKKQLLIVGITVVLIVVGLSGCTEEESDAYINEEYGFKITPPEGWTINENVSVNLVMFELNKPFEEWINEDDYASLSISPPTYLETGKTLSETIDEMIENYNITFTNFSFISKNSRTIDGLDAYEFVYVYDNVSFQLTVKQKQIAIEENPESVYLITYNASPDSYDRYLSIVEESINSFTIV